MGGGASTFEQARLRQQEGAAAHRGGASRVGRGGLQPGDQFQGIIHCLTNVRCAGHDQRIDRPFGKVAQSQCLDSQAFRRLDQTAVEARRVALVTGKSSFGHGFGGGPEHCLGPGQVEQAHLWVSNEDD
ncbi:hypothetical protein D3C84_1022740 [compost metagenome]